MNVLSPLQVGPPTVPNMRADIEKPPAIPKVEASSAADKSSLRQYGQNPEQTAQTALQNKTRQFADRDNDRHAGPPPSFEVNVLEVEHDLQQAIARIEAARGQIRDADGIKAD